MAAYIMARAGAALHYAHTKHDANGEPLKEDYRKPFKVGHLFLLQGKDHVEVQQGVPGDICAVAKVDEIQFDAVLHDAAEDDHIHLKPVNLPGPIYGLAIESKKRGDEHR